MSVSILILPQPVAWVRLGGNDKGQFRFPGNDLVRDGSLLFYLVPVNRERDLGKFDLSSLGRRRRRRHL